MRYGLRATIRKPPSILRALHSELCGRTRQGGMGISNEPAGPPDIAKSNVQQGLPNRSRSKEHDVAGPGGFAPALARELRGQTCGIRGGDQKPLTRAQPSVQACHHAARISKMLNDLKTHDPIEPACSGKTGKIPVGGNA
jgi:hypothetical protein